MGGNLSCVARCQSADKQDEGNRANDYAEIDNEATTSETTASPRCNDHDVTHDHDQVEQLYENSSSIMQGSSPAEPPSTSSGNPPLKPSTNGRANPKIATNGKPLANDVTVSSSNGRPPIPKMAPGAKKNATDFQSCSDKDSEKLDSDFQLTNSDEIGNYQNIKPMSLKKKKEPAAPIVAKEEREEMGDTYAQVVKPKPRMTVTNNNQPQLNYVEVEFLPSDSPPSPSKGSKDKPKRTTSPQTNYTDVIEMDGKMVLVTS